MGEIHFNTGLFLFLFLAGGVEDCMLFGQKDWESEVQPEHRCLFAKELAKCPLLLVALLCMGTCCPLVAKVYGYSPLFGFTDRLRGQEY